MAAGLVPELLGRLEWRSARDGPAPAERDEAVERVLIVDVLRLMAAEGPHASEVCPPPIALLLGLLHFMASDRASRFVVWQQQTPARTQQPAKARVQACAAVPTPRDGDTSLFTPDPWPDPSFDPSGSDTPALMTSEISRCGCR